MWYKHLTYKVLLYIDNTKTKKVAHYNNKIMQIINFLNNEYKSLFFLIVIFHINIKIIFIILFFINALVLNNQLHKIISILQIMDFRDYIMGRVEIYSLIHQIYYHIVFSDD